MANIPSDVLPQGERHPLTAAMLSIIPGLGQIYVGDRRKGVLFLDVALINYALIVLMCFSGSLLNGLSGFARTYRFDVNHEVLAALHDLQLGSPASFCIGLMTLMFVSYAARDAYDRAFGLQRKKIYGDSAVDFSEATSGSYLMHVALMGSCVILAALFVHPPSRIVERSITFEIDQDVPVAKVKPVTKVLSVRNVHRHGRHEKSVKQVVSHAGAFESAEASKPEPEENPQTQSRRHEQAQPKPERPRSEPSKSMPQPINAVQQSKTLAPPAVTAVAPGSMPLAPTPIAVPRPTRSTPLSMPVSSQNKVSLGQPAVPVPASNRGFLAYNGNPALSPSVAGFNAVAPGIRQLPETVAVGGNFSPAPMMVPTGGTSRIGLPNVVRTQSIPGAGTSGPGSAVAPIPAKLHGKPVDGADSFAVAPVSGPKGSKSSTIGKTNPSSDVDDRSASVDTRESPDFGRYMAELQRRIKRSWYPPKHSEKLRTIVTFSVSRDGTMSNLQILHSATLANYDDAAIKAVQSAAPFSSLPSGSPPSVDIEFTFDFNVLRSAPLTY